jgi:protein involved in polysaccharide export with SLBB domain
MKTISYGSRLFCCCLFILFLLNKSVIAQMLDGNDEIELIVPNYSELSGFYTLDTDGNMSIKIAHPIPLNNLYVHEAEKIIADTLKRYLISVTGLKIATVREWNEITVMGYVIKPGTYRLADRANLADALVSAGGVIKGALLNRIEVRRSAGEAAVQIVNYARFLFRGDEKLLPPLHAGDTIFVPKGLGEVNNGENLIYIFGAVRAPGIYEISGQTTLLDALAFVGGPLGNADLKHLKIIPAAADGRTRIYDFNSLEKRNTEVFLLKPGDTLLVPEKSRNYLTLVIQLVSSAALAINAYNLLKK